MRAERITWQIWVRIEFVVPGVVCHGLPHSVEEQSHPHPTRKEHDEPGGRIKFGLTLKF